jgi:hypothetical protein
MVTYDIFIIKWMLQQLMLRRRPVKIINRAFTKAEGNQKNESEQPSSRNQSGKY